jgi:hypothetical protein
MGGLRGGDREGDAVSLPYENATSGQTAINDMQKILRGFGVSSFGVMEEFDKGEVIVQFNWRERPVLIKASWKGYAAAWLRHHPQSYRSQLSKVEYERRAIKQAEISVYSILRDWIKGQVTAIEVGMLSFEGAFLGHILLADGSTVMERISETKLIQLPRPAA